MSTMIGSSPHERGTHGVDGAEDGDLRFIPARAGNTGLLTPSSTAETVHPRTSGEHAAPLCPPPPRAGSSPHERGTLRSSVGRRSLRRFIPARAGNTPIWSSSTPATSVHPRTSGEHLKRLPMSRAASGSSPHERGTQPLTLHCMVFLRFIPARAGNTRSGRGRRCSTAVHPRTSGEHTAAHTIPPIPAGSSPHERGTHIQQ